MFTLKPVTGHIGGECFLLTTAESALLIDSGFDFCAEKTAANIRAALNGRPLDYILATHSHYDHISGIPRIRRHFPELRTAGSVHAGKVFANPNARAQMRSLNADCARDAGIAGYTDLLDELSLDVTLEDGEEIRLPDLTIRALATPGHTRCAMSYYFPELDLLACSETIGIAPAYPEVTPCMIVGYRPTLDSIERSRRIGARRVFVSHTGMVPDGEANLFFDNASRAVENAVALLTAMHDRGNSEDEIVEAFTKEYYQSSAELQPERAFVLNTRALIPRILQELERAE